MYLTIDNDIIQRVKFGVIFVMKYIVQCTYSYVVGKPYTAKSTKTKRILETAGMKIIRRIAGKTLLDWQRSGDFRDAEAPEVLENDDAGVFQITNLRQDDEE